MSGKKAAKTTVWTTPDGQAITEDDAARLAQEFEDDDAALEGVEITFPRKAGRPSLAGGSGTSPQVTFRLSPSVRDHRVGTGAGGVGAARQEGRMSKSSSH